MDLKGKNVVVTGGSAGIGEGLADAFAARGARVLVAARSESALTAIAERTGGEYIVSDLSNPGHVDTFLAECLARLGHIDMFVNNAGVETNTSFAATDREDIRTLARLNFEAPLLLTRDVITHMLERGGGHVVQLSSVAGAIPFPGLAAYAGSKAGLTNFTETLRIEMMGSDIAFV